MLNNIIFIVYCKHFEFFDVTLSSFMRIFNLNIHLDRIVFIVIS